MLGKQISYAQHVSADSFPLTQICSIATKLMTLLKHSYCNELKICHSAEQKCIRICHKAWLLPFNLFHLCALILSGAILAQLTAHI